jgi:hypothetical protein
MASTSLAIEAVQDLASILCRDLVRKTVEWQGKAFVVTSFHYPSGDSINVYFEGGEDDLRITDMGGTVFNFRVYGVEMTPQRLQWVQAICASYDLNMEGSVFRKNTTRDRLGRDCLIFCEALTRIATLEYDVQPRQKSQLPQRVDSILREKVEPHRKIIRAWIDHEIDRNGSFPVDYRCNGQADPRHIFHVVSPDKATLVAAIAGLLKTHNRYVRTLSIVDPDANISTHHIDRVQMGSTDIKFGTEGNERDIERFALGEF